MSQVWTPLKSPPHPSTISGLSDLAEQVIRKIRNRFYEENSISLNYLHEDSVVPNLTNYEHCRSTNKFYLSDINSYSETCSLEIEDEPADEPDLNNRTHELSGDKTSESEEAMEFPWTGEVLPSQICKGQRTMLTSYEDYVGTYFESTPLEPQNIKNRSFNFEKFSFVENNSDSFNREKVGLFRPKKEQKKIVQDIKSHQATTSRPTSVTMLEKDKKVQDEINDENMEDLMLSIDIDQMVRKNISEGNFNVTESLINNVESGTEATVATVADKSIKPTDIVPLSPVFKIPKPVKRKRVTEDSVQNLDVKQDVVKGTDKNLKQKRIKFVPPLVKDLEPKKTIFKPPLARQTSETLQTGTIITLNNSSIKDMISQIVESGILEVYMSILYVDGTTQLIKPEGTRSKVDGFIMKIVWTDENQEYCHVRLDKQTDNVKKLCETLFVTNCKIVCYQAQEFLSLLLGVVKVERAVCFKSILHDPGIACWLLDPDNPATTFKDVVQTADIQVTDFTQRDPKNELMDCLAMVNYKLEEQLKLQNLWQIYSSLEIKLIPILAVMEERGLVLVEDKLREMGHVIDGNMKTLEAKAHKLAGRSFQLTSHVQLRQILYQELKLDRKQTTTKTGLNKSTSESTLKLLAKLHPLPDLIIQHRQLHKMKTTYVDGILTHSKKGIVRALWDQTSVSTGRLSSNNPNLQSIPKKMLSVDCEGVDDRICLNVRDCYVARPGYLFLSADFQHIELRVFAHLSNDPTLINILHQTDDVFVTLTKNWSNSLEVTDTEREKTKRIIYSVMYGAGANKLSTFLNVNNFEASKILNRFTANLSALKNFPKQVIEKCKKEKSLTTIFGRRRLFPNIDHQNYLTRLQCERQAINFLVQGSAADLCKLAMIATQEKFQHLDVHLVLQIHDELVWEVNEKQIQTVKDIVMNVMEDSKSSWSRDEKFAVPIFVKMSVGKSWGNMIVMQ